MVRRVEPTRRPQRSHRGGGASSALNSSSPPAAPTLVEVVPDDGHAHDLIDLLPLTAPPSPVRRAREIAQKYVETYGER